MQDDGELNGTFHSVDEVPVKNDSISETAASEPRKQNHGDSAASRSAVPSGTGYYSVGGAADSGSSNQGNAQPASLHTTATGTNFEIEEASEGYAFEEESARSSPDNVTTAAHPHASQTAAAWSPDTAAQQPLDDDSFSDLSSNDSFSTPPPRAPITAATVPAQFSDLPVVNINRLYGASYTTTASEVDPASLSIAGGMQPSSLAAQTGRHSIKARRISDVLSGATAADTSALMTQKVSASTPTTMGGAPPAAQTAVAAATAMGAAAATVIAAAGGAIAGTKPARTITAASAAVQAAAAAGEGSKPSSRRTSSSRPTSAAGAPPATQAQALAPAAAAKPPRPASAAAPQQQAGGLLRSSSFSSAGSSRCNSISCSRQNSLGYHPKQAVLGKDGVNKTSLKKQHSLPAGRQQQQQEQNPELLKPSSLKKQQRQKQQQEVIAEQLQSADLCARKSDAGVKHADLPEQEDAEPEVQELVPVPEWDGEQSCTSEPISRLGIRFWCMQKQM